MQKAQANLPLAKARFEAKPLQEMVSRSSDKLLDFIKTWQHEEYYNKAVDGLTELEALLPALEAYSTDSGVATVIKVAKERIASAQTLIPQARRKYEAEPLREKLVLASGKLDVRYTDSLIVVLLSSHDCLQQNFIKSWHYEEYFNIAVEALEEIETLCAPLEPYSGDTVVGETLRATKEKKAKAQANIPLAKNKFEAAPLCEQVRQHFETLNVLHRTPCMQAPFLLSVRERSASLSSGGSSPTTTQPSNHSMPSTLSYQNWPASVTTKRKLQ